ncbi:hypothetical protein B566_EDAN012123 [Ephemera danica]|nr:hypothetical protein B566_EDAN012123 [Ephemera danica]
MAKPRPCGCKGVRTCLICESEYGAEKKQLDIDEAKTRSYVYCPMCEKAWPGWDWNDYKSHPNHKGQPIEYPGVLVMENFLTDEEAEHLMSGLNALPWDQSQSGRRKQWSILFKNNFGPKCNFKKKRLVLGNFNGFPKFTQLVQKKFASVLLLHNFKTIEQCTLEYNPERGASIDPHIDDCWVWGERIVTVNVIGDSVLTMTPLKEKDRSRYNLHLAPQQFQQFPIETQDHVVRIPMPAKSLIVLYDQARYHWEHSVLRDDITELRVCLAYREFTTPYLENGEQFDDLAICILQTATNFWDNIACN